MGTRSKEYYTTFFAAKFSAQRNNTESMTPTRTPRGGQRQGADGLLCLGWQVARRITLAFYLFFWCVSLRCHGSIRGFPQLCNTSTLWTLQATQYIKAYRNAWPLRVAPLCKPWPGHEKKHKHTSSCIDMCSESSLEVCVTFSRTVQVQLFQQALWDNRTKIYCREQLLKSTVLE
jgi:hypothetical protein